jgi:hypothetical protein
MLVSGESSRVLSNPIAAPSAFFGVVMGALATIANRLPIMRSDEVAFA